MGHKTIVCSASLLFTVSYKWSESFIIFHKQDC